MKIFVEHDAEGNIHAIGVAVGTSATTVLRAGPGRHLSQVEAPQVQHEKDYDNLRKIKHHYQVEGHPSQPSLRKRA
jgi:hypothetical protein